MVLLEERSQEFSLVLMQRLHDMINEEPFMVEVNRADKAKKHKVKYTSIWTYFMTHNLFLSL